MGGSNIIAQLVGDSNGILEREETVSIIHVTNAHITAEFGYPLLIL